ncbi:MAG TPA: DMT family transporter [Acidimicrobiales bacterium]
MTAQAASTRTPAPTRNLGILAVVTAVVGLSTGSTLVKLTGSPGSVVAFWRLVFGGLIWFGLLLIGGKRISWRTFRRVAPIGALFGLNLLLFFSAVRATRVANAEFIGTLTPVITVPMAALVFHERIRWRALAFGGVAMAGVALIVFNAPARGSQSLRGDLLAVGAIITWSIYLLFARRLRESIGVVEFMATVTAVAAIVVAPLAASTGEMFSLTAKGWILCVVLGMVTGTIGHGLIQWAQRVVELSVITVMQVGQPALAAFWAWLLLDESVKGIQVAGMVIVLMSLLGFTLTMQAGTVAHVEPAPGDGYPAVASNKGSSEDTPG